MLIIEQNAWHSFWDDRRRYGWRVALYNILIVAGIIPIVQDESDEPKTEE
jgi:hypothetical protein